MRFSLQTEPAATGWTVDFCGQPGVHDDGQVQPASVGAHVGDVGDPEPVRPFGVEVAVHEIGRGASRRCPARFSVTCSPWALRSAWMGPCSPSLRWHHLELKVSLHVFGDRGIRISVTPSRRRSGAPATWEDP